MAAAGEKDMIDKPVKKGRPIKGETAKTDNLIIRVEPEIIKALDRIVETEGIKTGYSLNRSNIIRKALAEFIERYDS